MEDLEIENQRSEICKEFALQISAKKRTENLIGEKVIKNGAL